MAGGLPVVLGGLWWLLLGRARGVAHLIRETYHKEAPRERDLKWAAAAGVPYGARRGWYHIYILPLICLEHERGELACLGALDALALVCVGCGACAAQLAQPRPRPTKREADADQALALRGLLVGGCCGDYVEACHPFLARDPILDGATYAGSVLAALVSAGSASSAYLPVPLSFLAAERPGRFLVRRVCGVWRALRRGLCVEHEGGARESRGVVRRGSASSAAPASRRGSRRRAAAARRKSGVGILRPVRVNERHLLVLVHRVHEEHLLVREDLVPFQELEHGREGVACARRSAA